MHPLRRESQFCLSDLVLEALGEDMLKERAGRVAGELFPPPGQGRIAVCFPKALITRVSFLRKSERMTYHRWYQ